LAYLFAAHRTTGGKVGWGYAAPQGIDTVRARGMKVILSTGGAGSGISFTSRTVSTEFVDSIEAINASWGGTRARPAFDGLDFNTFEADATPNTTEYVWMAQELKRRFGSSFLITCPPAPWNTTDRAFVKSMLAAGALDYAAPQYYDGPGLSDPTYIANSVRTWINDVAAGNASKIVVGFGIEPGAANYSTTAQVAQAWNQIEAEFPTIRGAFVWSHTGDQANGWGFATTIAPLIRN
jgi:chitinase